jgi:hypothetical protein
MEILNKLEKWSFLAPEDIKLSIETNEPMLMVVRTIYTRLEEIYYHYMYKYIKCIKYHDVSKDISIFSSGFIFFYGAISFVWHYKDWGNYIEAICHYNTLYLLFDFYLDSASISSKNKLMLVELLKTTLEEDGVKWTLEDIKTINDPVITTLFETYYKLVSVYPETIIYLRKIFNEQVAGFYEPKKSAKFLYDSSMKKGGYTLELLCSIVGETDTQIKEATFNIGCIVQFLDDMMDIEKDIKANINTIATNYYYSDQSTKLFDELVLDIATRIDHLPPFFNLYKVIGTNALWYVINTIPKENVSLLMSTCANRYDIFPSNLNKVLDQKTKDFFYTIPT